MTKFAYSFARRNTSRYTEDRFAHDFTSNLHPLLDLSAADLSPSVQTIPTTIAGANALSGATFTEWWVCNVASGNLVGDGGTTLTKGAGTIRYERVVPGWNGTDYTTGYRAIEFVGTDSTPQSFAAAANSTYDLDQSITLVGCGRLLRPPGANRAIVAKWLNDTTAGSYRLTATSAGTLSAGVRGSAATISVSGPGVLVPYDGFANGSVQWFALKLDTTAGFATLMLNGAAGTPVALPSGAVAASATPFRVGGAPTLFSCELFQLLCFGVLTGADAEAFTIDHLNALDNWCAVPSALSGHVRYSVLAPPVGSDATGVRVQHLAGSATTIGLNHFAHAMIGTAVGPLASRGVDSAVAKRNRLLRTDDLNNAAWTKSNVTTAAAAGEDPAGFTGAASLTASADNGTVVQNFTGEGDSKDVTVSVYAQRIGGSDVACRLALYDSSGPTELAGVDITVGALRERFSLTVPGATVGIVTTLQWRLTIATSGTAVYATFAQAEWGWLTPYQPQLSALADKDDPQFYIDNSSAQALDIVAGRVEVTCVGLVDEVDSTGAFVFSTDCGASFEDRMFIQRDALASIDPDEGRIYDSAGDIVAQLTDLPTRTHTDAITYAMEWDSRHGLDGEHVCALVDVDRERVRTGAAVPSASWTTGSNADRVFLGMRHTMTAHLEGIITSFKSWGRVR